MKMPSKPICVVALTLSILGLAFAQGAGLSGRPLREEDRQDVRKPNQQAIVLRVLGRLDLTEDQRDRVRQVVQSTKKQAQGIRKDVRAGRITKEEAQKQQKAMRQEYLRSIRSILTREQARQFVPMLREEIRKARAAAGLPVAPPPPVRNGS